MTSAHSAFNWQNEKRDSIFAADPAFRASKSSGKSQSQIGTEAVEAYARRTGKSAGSIRGISARGNLLIEESESKRRSKR